jgi:hypothetical protein
MRLFSCTPRSLNLFLKHTDAKIKKNLTTQPNKTLLTQRGIVWATGRKIVGNASIQQKREFSSLVDTQIPLRKASVVADAPSDPEGVTGILSNWVHSVELSDVPAEILERTKFLILDGIACALVAARLPESRIATEAIMDIESRGDCTVIGWDTVDSTRHLCIGG